MSLFALVAVMLAACGTDESTPGTEPVVTEENTLAQSPEPTQDSITATGTPGAGNPPETIPVTGDLNPARLTNLLDFMVMNQAGEQIGEVQNMIMDLDTSMIQYVIVSRGGFLNVGERQVAVPWSALQVQGNTADTTSAAQSFFTLAVDQDVFINAPAFSPEQDLPAMGRPGEDWDKEIKDYWKLEAGSTILPSTSIPPATSDQASGTGQTPTPEGMPLRGIVLATDALGFDFKLQGEEDLNISVDDIIINIQSGKILYLVIHTNFENASEQWIPIPHSMLRWDPPNRAYLLNVDKVTLQSAPFYIDNIYPDTTRPGWDESYVYFWKQHGLTVRP